MLHLHLVALEQAGLPVVVGCATVTFSEIVNLNSIAIQCESVCVNVL